MKSNLLSKCKIEIRSFEFKYVTHECVDLVSLQEILFGCILCGCCASLSCCSRIEFIQTANRRRTTLSRHRSGDNNVGNLDTNEQELARTIAIVENTKLNNGEINMLNVAGGIKNIIDYNADMNTDDSMNNAIVYEASINETITEVGNRKRGGQDENGWWLWSQQQVSKWISNILTKSGFDDDKIEHFMDKFNQHLVNGQVLKNIQGNTADLNQLFSILGVPFSMWLPVRNAINSLHFSSDILQQDQFEETNDISDIGKEPPQMNSVTSTGI